MSTAPQGKAGGPGREPFLTALLLGALYPVLSRLVDSSVVALVCSVALGFVVSGLLRQRAQARDQAPTPADAGPGVPGDRDDDGRA
ncbi:hypothetical protein AS188_09505 [Kocuria flava]|uniref:Uncharacterized protein n=1 Tax=Kocuria flava TaxID=446860 RepID=A0A0U2WU89_9MICC|nr:hypothetical protein [Kocuria flava]ALU39940.1 hypothetical protein AS188_09505 [Kocuria flava]GEO93170.1 hypothetical protein KFL01_24760 [Kocuria flava]